MFRLVEIHTESCVVCIPRLTYISDRTTWGRPANLHARALEIFGGGGRASPERLDFGDSKPASAEDRLSGVEASMMQSVMLRAQEPASLAGEMWAKSGQAEVDTAEAAMGLCTTMHRITVSLQNPNQGSIPLSSASCLFLGRPLVAPTIWC